jgi:hypothetical protein
VRRAAALAVLVAVVGGVVVLVRMSDGPSSPPATADARVVPGRVVHVESGVRTTTFLPLGLGPQDGRTLSAQRAYNALVSDSPKLNPIPATVRPYYGVLTDSAASPAADHVRVWGFAVDSGCRDGDDSVPSEVGASTGASRCRLWEFVDARTGHHLGEISQEVLPN